jgi:ABC-2 type transport system ATP-binding protein
MKQKLALAAGLMHKPQLFFLDEPTTGVDPVSRRDFWQLLYQLNKDGTTIFVSTPYMDEAELCSRVAFMHNGRIVACAAPQDLRHDYPYKILELTAPRRDVKQYLRSCPIIETNMFGNTYHLVVTDTAAAIPQIQVALATAGITIETLKEITPTLDDVFVY